MPAPNEGVLLPAEWFEEFKLFEPHARYFGPLDQLVYLNADLPYRAQWIDPVLDVLLHPQEHRPIGVKISGFASIIERELPDILGPRAIAWALLRSLGRAAARFTRRTQFKIRRLFT